MTDQEVAVLEATLANQEKCTKQFALSVRKNVKFHSSQRPEKKSFAKNVTLKKSQDTKPLLIVTYF